MQKVQVQLPIGMLMYMPNITVTVKLARLKLESDACLYVVTKIIIKIISSLYDHIVSKQGVFCEHVQYLLVIHIYQKLENETGMTVLVSH